MHSGSGGMFLVYQVISQDHVIKWSCDFIGGSPSWQVTIMPSLVAIANVVVEIFLVTEGQEARFHILLLKSAITRAYSWILLRSIIVCNDDDDVDDDDD